MEGARRGGEAQPLKVPRDTGSFSGGSGQRLGSEHGSGPGKPGRALTQEEAKPALVGGPSGPWQRPRKSGAALCGGGGAMALPREPSPALAAGRPPPLPPARF